mmetsp:Transcript_4538/g.10478  ORF Transcript_4538/g.10478 Transcript_4538/m.10478 type:complete len:223 (+) Transcript_4538:1671-2339(+)
MAPTTASHALDDRRSDDVAPETTADRARSAADASSPFCDPATSANWSSPPQRQTVRLSRSNSADSLKIAQLSSTIRSLFGYSVICATMVLTTFLAWHMSPVPSPPRSSILVWYDPHIERSMPTAASTDFSDPPTPFRRLASTMNCSIPSATSLVPQEASTLACRSEGLRLISSSVGKDLDHLSTSSNAADTLSYSLDPPTVSSRSLPSLDVRIEWIRSLAAT